MTNSKPTLKLTFFVEDKKIVSLQTIFKPNAFSLILKGLLSPLMEASEKIVSLVYSLKETKTKTIEHSPRVVTIEEVVA